MTSPHMQAYRDARISMAVAAEIQRKSRRPVRLMEVCGTHTMSLFKHGIRALLPSTVRLISGPGCPVCVTAQNEIDAFIAMAKIEEVILVTFGDLMRVPGTVSSLQEQRAEGSDIRVVYSAMDALEIARKHPRKRVVFLGVGFETTAPTIAAAILTARQMSLDNFLVYSAHKLVPPALLALMQTDGVRIDGFILPGHVSVVIGLEAYASFFKQYRIPCVVTGFEPTDILQGIARLVLQVENGVSKLENGYPRAVTAKGNVKAQQVLKQVFSVVDAPWRGIGVIPRSGLRIKKELAAFDAERAFKIALPEAEDPKGCACGDILTGLKTPPECTLYKKRCTPVHPVGPCMVSSEGTCAAYYRYHAGNCQGIPVNLGN